MIENMGKVVVKRFPDDEVFGAGNQAIARWAKNHNARVVSQSASKGWITVTFEALDQEPVETEHMIYAGPSSTIIQTRLATDEELREALRQEMRSKAENPQETRITRIHSEEPEEAKPEKPKKRWWGR